MVTTLMFQKTLTLTQVILLIQQDLFQMTQQLKFMQKTVKQKKKDFHMSIIQTEQ